MVIQEYHLIKFINAIEFRNTPDTIKRNKSMRRCGNFTWITAVNTANITYKSIICRKNRRGLKIQNFVRKIKRARNTDLEICGSGWISRPESAKKVLGVFARRPYHPKSQILSLPLLPAAHLRSPKSQLPNTTALELGLKVVFLFSLGVNPTSAQKDNLAHSLSASMFVWCIGPWVWILAQFDSKLKQITSRNVHFTSSFI